MGCVVAVCRILLKYVWDMMTIDARGTKWAIHDIRFIYQPYFLVIKNDILEMITKVDNYHTT